MTTPGLNCRVKLHILNTERDREQIKTGCLAMSLESEIVLVVCIPLFVFSLITVSPYVLQERRIKLISEASAYLCTVSISISNPSWSRSVV